MECPNCRKEASAEATYCSSCGKLLKTTKNNQQITANTKKGSLGKRALLDFALWAGVCMLLSGIFYLVDSVDGFMYTYGTRTEPIFWAREASIITVILGFNIAFAHSVRPIIKDSGRNVAAWTTAFIVFSPLLAGTVYLLASIKKKDIPALVLTWQGVLGFIVLEIVAIIGGLPLIERSHYSRSGIMGDKSYTTYTTYESLWYEYRGALIVFLFIALVLTLFYTRSFNRKLQGIICALVIGILIITSLIIGSLK